MKVSTSNLSSELGTYYAERTALSLLGEYAYYRIKAFEKTPEYKRMMSRARELNGRYLRLTDRRTRGGKLIQNSYEPLYKAFKVDYDREHAAERERLGDGVVDNMAGKTVKFTRYTPL